MRRMVYAFTAILLLLLLVVSCGKSSDSPVSVPDETLSAAPDKVVSGGSKFHDLWGLWEFVIDPVNQTVDYYNVREAEFHLNVLPFLEPPPLLNLTLEGDIIFDIPNNTLQVGIGLTHPFAGLNEFAGFDVKGIVISRADPFGNTPSNGYKMPGDTVLELRNQDGLTRMWNPDEFPYDVNNEIFGYKDGLLGAPDSYGQYDAQINGFKYFCDGLLPDAPVPDMDFARRGLFSPGTKNIRTYLISTPQGLIFQYAVDASWEFPSGAPPWTIPDDYPITANCPEAFFIDASTNGVMFSGDGGSNMTMTIEVYDHQPGTIQEVWVEAKDIFAESPPTPSLFNAVFQYTTTNFDVYTVSLHNYSGAAAGLYPALIGVVDTAPNPFIAGENFMAYQQVEFVVTENPVVSISLEEDAAIKGSPYWGVDFGFDALQQAVPPSYFVDYTDFDGPWEFSYAWNEVITFSSLAPMDPEVIGFSSGYPSEVDHFWKGGLSFGPNFFQPYYGEDHDTVTGKRKMYGLTEPGLIGGTYLFTDAFGANVPMEFQYPYFTGVDFTTSGAYILPGPVPIEVFEAHWRVRALGEGLLSLSEGGTQYSTLFLRHDLTIEFNNIPSAWMVMYEWLQSDGRPLAYIISGNAPGFMGNFDPNTGIILGQSKYLVAQGY